MCRPYQLMVMKFCGKGKLSDVKQWALQVLKYRGEAKLSHEFDAWELPIFPVNGNLLKENGVQGTYFRKKERSANI